MKETMKSINTFLIMLFLKESRERKRDRKTSKKNKD